MCFSPEASFAGSVVISSIGVAAIKSVRTPSQKIFAGIPLLFGIQQFAEGVLWLTIPYPEYELLQKISTFLFLLMARVIWPMMIPLSVLLMEKIERKKKTLRILLAMGLSVSFYYTYCLLFLHVTPNIAEHHIQYISDYPESLATPVFGIYFVASIVPLFISSVQRTKLLGALMFVSSIATMIFFMHYLTSVWCFFAALISGVVLWILREPEEK
jgi:hypothetical protein